MSARDFPDHFSGHADTYARYRPDYPRELFDWLTRRTVRHQLAWDCATGNGQAARALAARFERVIATDASERQIAAAEAGAGIEYRVAAAEDSGIAAASVDLVCVAQAAHWLDPAGFGREAERVLPPGGLLAVWGYGLCSIGPDLDPALQHLYAERLGGFWPEQRRHIDQAYRSLAFPFPELDAPTFEMRADWSCPQLLGYLSSWSAVQRYRRARDQDPLTELTELCNRYWPAGQRRTVRWPLFVRAGHKPAPPR